METTNQRLCDSARSAARHAEAGAGRHQGQHQAHARAAEIVRPQVGVQRQLRHDAPRRLRPKILAGETCRTEQTAPRQPQQIAGAQPPGGTEAGQWRQQCRAEPLAHVAPPLGQAPPGRSIVAEGTHRFLDIARDGRRRAVRRGMTAFAVGVGPLQSGAPQIERAEGGAVVGEGEEGGADIVKIARQRQFFRIHGSAGSALRLQHQHLPAVPRQRRRRRQTVRPRSDHHGIHDILREQDEVARRHRLSSRSQALLGNACREAPLPAPERARREAELRNRAFPSRAWERGTTR